MPLKFYIIVAACENMGIGYKGDLPWKLPKEMSYFKRMTRDVETEGKMNATIMGRRTWESIPDKFRPLAHRFNIVITRNPMNISHPLLSSHSSLEAALKELQNPHWREQIETIWIIGGNSLFKEAMDSPFCHRIYLTQIFKNFKCDTFFPPIDATKFQLIDDPRVPEAEEEENGIKYKFEVYQRL